ncbi:29 kDa ribonucleoprotein A, chloroplastic [Selaginella moellendorffii]|uniref:29 kDa ribonucleoprotein A, chloroplastic n=1 Tax=Selaginella moellendorffii TaxID=88036 RepID=UPI000D1C903E|nr:29 kDa ribonucleoprotein A, chloroplastic [Selaginella moellendorffii]|eukprot:XP_024518534.1 29 kDa ribonucleoprotein A, chloroplastic [Selaginella moellendorffii]
MAMSLCSDGGGGAWLGISSSFYCARSSARFRFVGIRRRKMRGLCVKSEIDSSVARPSRIYVGNLSWNCDSEELAKVLQQAGILAHVEEVEVVCDRETGRSRGFGYVTLTSIDFAQVAVQKLDGHIVQGRALKASYSQPYKKAGKEGPVEVAASHTKVFIGNLPWGVDDGSLEEFFRAHGKVVEVKIVYDRDTGRSRGFGFVTLSSPKEADEAVKSLDGADCDGRRLRVKLADTSPVPPQ